MLSNSQSRRVGTDDNDPSRSHEGAAAVNSVEEKLLSYINQELVSLSNGEVQSDTSLVDVIDSAAIMELVVWIEGTFGFVVELEDLHEHHFGSVRLLGQWIDKNLVCASS